MIRRAVALGGPPGSGTTTSGRLVALELGLEYRSVGEEFRAEATRRGLDLAAFGRYAEAHPEVDRELDRSFQALARPGRLLEGRLQGALCRRHGIPVHWVALTAAEEERVRRVADRDGLPIEEARRRLKEREASERERYARFYGIDLDREVPDLLVDSTRLPAEGVARTIVDFLRARDAEGSG